jgi:DNA-directed RNA polymerase subunit RPC12/RpoP
MMNSHVMKISQLFVRKPNRKQMWIRRILKPYKCDHCGTRFGAVQNLVLHKGIAHVPQKCSYCSLQFIHTWSLARHISERHTSNRRKDSLLR